MSAVTAIATWQRVLEQHPYARARGQLAELYLAAGKPDLAKSERSEGPVSAPPSPHEPG